MMEPVVLPEAPLSEAHGAHVRGGHHQYKVGQSLHDAECHTCVWDQRQGQG